MADRKHGKTARGCDVRLEPGDVVYVACVVTAILLIWCSNQFISAVECFNPCVGFIWAGVNKAFQVTAKT